MGTKKSTKLPLIAIFLAMILTASMDTKQVEYPKNTRAGKNEKVVAKLETIESVRLHPFSNILANMGNSFWGWNSLYWVGAGVSTAILVESGADRDIQEYFREENPIGQGFAKAFYWMGNFIQPLIGATFYLGGLIYQDNYIINGGAAILQALGINALYNLTLKYITGRVRPICSGPNLCSTPNEFEFAPWKRNLINGRHSWPSGHTASMFALTSVSHAYFRKDWIAWVGYPIAATMGIATIEADFHWASDVAAGFLMGIIVGYVVGNNFREVYDASLNKKVSLNKVKPGYFKVMSVNPVSYFGGDGRGGINSFLGLQIIAKFQ